MPADLFSKRGDEPVSRESHASYIFRIAFPDGTEKDVYCPVCLADRDGHYPNGKPKYSGGRVNVRTQEAADRQEAGGVLPRYSDFAACSCFVGDLFAESWNKRLSRGGKSYGMKRWRDFHPSLRLCDGQRFNVKVVETYGVQDEEGDQA